MKFTLTKNTTNALKVFSALLVMAHHYVLFLMPEEAALHSWFLWVLHGQCGVLGVAVFFFLSGYGLMESETRSHLSLKAFAKRRFLKVYLPVVLVTAIWMVVCEIIPEFTHPSDEGVWRIIWGLFFSFNDAVMWFVRVLICLYVIFYLFVLMYKHNKTVGCAFLAAATIGLMAVVWAHFGPYATISIPLFPIGMILSLYGKRSRGVYLVLGMLAALAVAYYFIYYYYAALAFHSSVNFMLIALLLVICSVRRIDIAVPAVLGAMSFDLYLIHNKVISVVYNKEHLRPFLVYLLITVVCTLLFFFLRTKILGKKKSKTLA